MSTPDRPGGTASKITNGSERVKLCHRNEVDQHHCQDEPDAKAGEGLFHIADRTAHRNGHPIRPLNLSDDGFDLLIYPTKIFLLRHDVDIEHAAQLIVVYFRWRIDLSDCSTRLERRCNQAMRRPERDLLEVGHGLDLGLRVLHGQHITVAGLWIDPETRGDHAVRRECSNHVVNNISGGNPQKASLNAADI